MQDFYGIQCVMELDNLREKCELVLDCIDAVREQIDLSSSPLCISGWVDGGFNIL